MHGYDKTSVGLSAQYRYYYYLLSFLSMRLPTRYSICHRPCTGYSPLSYLPTALLFVAFLLLYDPKSPRDTQSDDAEQNQG